MAEITLRVLDGADRGRAHDSLPTPVTIGREEGNTVQLNDERVSRFHVKIQEDRDKVVLTDLDSTNGSKVNGEEASLRILRHGDIITIGRTVLLYGTREQIATRLAKLRGADPEQGDEDPPAPSLDYELNWGVEPDGEKTLQSLEPPEAPDSLGPAQAAQLAELLEYFHLRIRDLLAAVKVKPDADRISLEARQWQSLIDLQARLAEYLRAISHPDEQE